MKNTVFTTEKGIELALKTAIESAQGECDYITIWKTESGDFDWSKGDSRWANEVLADDPHLTWQMLEACHIIDDGSELEEIERRFEVDGQSEVTHEHVYKLVGLKEAVNREFEAVTCHPDWDDFREASK